MLAPDPRNKALAEDSNSSSHEMMLYAQLSFLLLYFTSRPYASKVNLESAIQEELEAQDSPD